MTYHFRPASTFLRGEESLPVRLSKAADQLEQVERAISYRLDTIASCNTTSINLDEVAEVVSECLEEVARLRERQHHLVDIVRHLSTELTKR
jgi:TnpA family transposase